MQQYAQFYECNFCNSYNHIHDVHGKYCLCLLGMNPDNDYKIHYYLHQDA